MWTAYYKQHWWTGIYHVYDKMGDRTIWIASFKIQWMAHQFIEEIYNKRVNRNFTGSKK